MLGLKIFCPSPNFSVDGVRANYGTQGWNLNIPGYIKITHLLITPLVGNLEVGNLEGIQGSRFYYKHVGRRDWHIRRWWVNTALERNLDRESAGGVWGRARPNTNTHRFIFQESLFLLAASTSAEETLQLPFLHCEIGWLCLGSAATLMDMGSVHCS